MDPWRSLDAVLAAIERGPRPDLLLVTGDLTQDLGEPVLTQLRDRLASLADRVLALPGNHDDPEVLAQVFPGSPLDTRATSHELGGWQLLLMDTSRPGWVGGEMGAQRLEALEFLVQDRRPILCAGHHPPLACGSAWLDAIGLKDGATLLARLARHPQVRGMLFGHIHQALDRRQDGLRLLGTPATSFQFRPGRAQFALDTRRPGYRTVKLWPDGRMTSRVSRVALPAA